MDDVIIIVLGIAFFAFILFICWLAIKNNIEDKAVAPYRSQQDSLNKELSDTKKKLDSAYYEIKELKRALENSKPEHSAQLQKQLDIALNDLRSCTFDLDQSRKQNNNLKAEIKRLKDSKPSDAYLQSKLREAYDELNSCKHELSAERRETARLRELLDAKNQETSEQLESDNIQLREKLDASCTLISELQESVRRLNSKNSKLESKNEKLKKEIKDIAFWQDGLGEIQFRRSDLSHYVTDHMKVIDSSVPAAKKISRLSSAFDKEIKILSVSLSGEAKIQGATIDRKTGKPTEYTTTLHSCTCEDFVKGRYKTPCKHMYRLAIELGLISIYDKSIHAEIKRESAKIKAAKVTSKKSQSKNSQ